MGKKKAADSWADRLDTEKAERDPVIASFEALKHSVEPQPEPSGLEAVVLRRRCIDLEIRAKELELGLYLAKAKICEFELEKLKKGD